MLARLLTAIALFASAAGAEPPTGYYDTAAGLGGEALRTALHEIIDDHTIIPYADLLGPIRVLWEDPEDASKIKLIYGGARVAKTATSWNREHLWPRSRGVNPATLPNGGPDDSDLFHVVPADGDVNSARSNRYFDMSSMADGGFADPAHPEAPQCTKDVNSWEPPAAERGDLARAIFYMAVRYDGGDLGTTDLEIATSGPSENQMANLATLLAWHAADPPDAAERARNNRIFSTYQHNRNPFIDHPEWVSAIWGTLTGNPTAQVTASTRGAFERPTATATFAVTLNQPAPQGGLVVVYDTGGTATSVDYTLSGTGVDTVAKTITIPHGVVSVSLTVTPADDGLAEATEKLQMMLLAGADYDAIGAPASVFISDDQSIPPGVLAAWSFDAVPYGTVIPASTGTGSLNTATWTGTVSNFNGVTGQSLALVGSAGNNSYIEVGFSAAGWTNLRIGFQTRRNAVDSFLTGTWSWSTDGVQFTPIAGENTVATSEEFQARVLDLSGIPSLRNAPALQLRYTLAGATNTFANNRIDDLVISGVRYSSAWLTRFPNLSGASAEQTADADGDTLSNLQEWAFDTDPLAISANSVGPFGVISAPDPEDGNAAKLWPTVQFTRRTDTLSLEVNPEQSADLHIWTGDCVLLSTSPGPTPQSEVVLYRGTHPLGTGNTFFRVRVRSH